MLLIESLTANIAWREVLKSLLNSPQVRNSTRYARDELTIVRIEQSRVEPADPLFPMKQSDLDIINHYICTGENEEKVVHEWTKLYYHRMFDPPNSQVDFIIRQLRSKELESRCQISLWDKDVDQDAPIAPCTQIIWARKKSGGLELHVHAHSVDAYRKLLMNMHEFIAFHNYLAGVIGIPVGPYYHLIDSCHIHTADLDDAVSVLNSFKTRIEQL